MRHWINSWIIVLALLLPSLPMEAQGSAQALDPNSAVSTQDLGDMMSEIDNYIQQVSNLLHLVNTTKKAKTLANYSRDLNGIETQWQYVSQSMQDAIAQYPDLLTLAQQYQTLFDETKQAIENQKTVIEASADYKSAKKIILSNQNNYKQWDAQAKQLTLTPKTAPLLERLKAEEAVKFQEIDAAYQKAQAAVEKNNSLSKDMEQLKEKYIDMKMISENIQAAKYVPFIDRIKDYLMSIAGVAIIIMFISVMSSKLQALKAAREQAMKFKEMLEQNNQDIPTI